MCGLFPIHIFYGLCIPLNASPITGVRKEEKGGGPQHQTHPSLNRGKHMGIYMLYLFFGAPILEVISLTLFNTHRGWRNRH